MMEGTNEMETLILTFSYISQTPAGWCHKQGKVVTATINNKQIGNKRV